MAQREPMRTKLRFERGAVGAALDQRGARCLIDLLQLTHLSQVDRDCTLVAVALRLDAAAHAPPPAGRRPRRVGAPGPAGQSPYVPPFARFNRGFKPARLNPLKPALPLPLLF